MFDLFFVLDLNTFTSNVSNLLLPLVAEGARAVNLEILISPILIDTLNRFFFSSFMRLYLSLLTCASSPIYRLILFYIRFIYSFTTFNYLIYHLLVHLFIHLLVYSLLTYLFLQENIYSLTFFT